MWHFTWRAALVLLFITFIALYVSLTGVLSSPKAMCLWMPAPGPYRFYLAYKEVLVCKENHEFNFWAGYDYYGYYDIPVKHSIEGVR